jgi:hypothetical protein
MKNVPMFRPWRGLVASACLLPSLCAPPPPVTKENIPDLLAPIGKFNDVCGLKGFGDIRLTINGQRAKAKFDVVWQGDSNFTLNIYSPFGGLLVSISADSTGAWTITSGDSCYKKQPGEHVALGEASIDYPFSYVEFLHAVIGRFPDRIITQKRPDSLFIERKNAFLLWQGDSSVAGRFAVTAIINRKHSAVTDVIYREAGQAPWELTFSSFGGGGAKEIRFNDSHNNYFYVTYERIVVLKSGPACRGGKV